MLCLLGRFDVSRAALLSVLIIAAPSAAAAEAGTPDRDAARSLANEAANAYARGDYVSAHSLCERAFALVKAPTIALLSARSLTRMGRWVEAVDAYNRVLRADLGQDAPAAFQRARTEAQAELASLEPRVPRLKVVVEPTRAPVVLLLDGSPVPDALRGVWMPADPRSHTLVVQVGGEPAASQSVLLREGESRVITVLPPRQSEPSPLRTWGYVGLGVGGAGLAVGAVTGLLAMNAREEADSACRDRRCEAGSAGADAVDRFRSFRAISTVGYAVGLAAAAAGTIVLLRSGGESDPNFAVSASLDGVRLTGAL